MHNFGVMAQVLLTGENRFLSPRDFKELGVAKRSRSTTSARSALQQPWSIIGRTNFLKAATNLNLCRCSLPHLVRVRSVRDHHTRRQSHTASMDELACSEFMFWRSCLRLPHSRLGYPRSGLSRSDLVRWARRRHPATSALTSAVRGKADSLCSRVLFPGVTRMYGPAARCKRFRQPGRYGLASMYSVSDWSMCSGPSWISARMRSS